MITRPDTIRYSIDKLELSYRFGKNSHIPVYTINDLLEQLHLRGDVTVGKRKSGSHRVGSSFNSCIITMKQYPFETIYVETGAVKDRTAKNQGDCFTYAKFVFNHDRITKHEDANTLLHSVMLDILPGGGYQELIDEGHILYAEFAIDLNFIRMHEVDIFSPLMDRGRVYFGNDGSLETVSISNSEDEHRESSFTVYDKARQLKANKAYITRGALVRIEAKRRFQSHSEVQEIDRPANESDREPICRLDRCTQERLGIHLHLRQRCTLPSQSTGERLTGGIFRYNGGGQGETYQDAATPSAYVVELHRTLGALLHDVAPRCGTDCAFGELTQGGLSRKCHTLLRNFKCTRFHTRIQPDKRQGVSRNSHI